MYVLQQGEHADVVFGSIGTVRWSPSWGGFAAQVTATSGTSLEAESRRTMNHGLKVLALGAAFAVSATIAKADSINGSFFIQGNDTYTPSSVTFGTATVGAGLDTGTQGISGSFAAYLRDGDLVVFTSPITYTQGTNMVNPAATAFTIYDGSSTGGALYNLR